MVAGSVGGRAVPTITWVEVHEAKASARIGRIAFIVRSQAGRRVGRDAKGGNRAFFRFRDRLGGQRPLPPKFPPVPGK